MLLSKMKPAPSVPQRPNRSQDGMRNKIRVKDNSMRTEQACIYQARRQIRVHCKRHSDELRVEAVEAFVTHLAEKRNVAAATQHRAESALLFLYRDVPCVELPWLEGVVSAKQPQHLQVVLSATDMATLLAMSDQVLANAELRPTFADATRKAPCRDSRC